MKEGMPSLPRPCDLSALHKILFCLLTLCCSAEILFAQTNTGPGFKGLDLAVVKRFPFGEAKNLEFRMETFNVFNNTNFDLPNRFAFTPNFGKVFSAGQSRQIQFGLKFLF